MHPCVSPCGQRMVSAPKKAAFPNCFFFPCSGSLECGPALGAAAGGRTARCLSPAVKSGTGLKKSCRPVPGLMARPHSLRAGGAARWLPGLERGASEEARGRQGACNNNDSCQHMQCKTTAQAPPRFIADISFCPNQGPRDKILTGG